MVSVLNSNLVATKNNITTEMSKKIDASKMKLINKATAVGFEANSKADEFDINFYIETTTIYKFRFRTSTINQTSCYVSNNAGASWTQLY